MADSYCNADPLTKEFYNFVGTWKATAAEATVPSTTAKDVLGTQTAASLYYTPNAAVSTKRANSAAALNNGKRGWKKGRATIVALIAGLVASR